MITAERLRELLAYDPETGVFTWLVARSNHIKVGDIAGWLNGEEGYTRIKVDGHPYMAHRLAWLHVTGSWPVTQIDHVNCTRDDNRWTNLREATQSQNAANVRIRGKTKASGFKGVHRHGRRWKAVITKDGRNTSLGYFDAPEEAHAAYVKAAREYHGEFARAG
jgi:hypothetical protein